MAKIISCAMYEEYDVDLLKYKAIINDFGSIPSAYREYVLKVYSKGIITGRPDKTFGFADNAARDQAAAIIARYIDKNRRKPPVIQAVHKDIITVSTAEELTRAIGPDREIVLKPGTYNLTRASGSYTGNEYAYWEEVFDGEQLIIRNVSNLTITRDESGGTAGAVTPEILVEPRYANVITFKNCSNVQIIGLKAGHSPEKGECAGGVLYFEGCSNVEIARSELFGCGTEGLILTDVEDLVFYDSVITDCTYGIMSMSFSKNISFLESSFTENEQYDLINIDNSTDVTFNECIISDNHTLTGDNEYIDYSLFHVFASSDITVSDSTISDNTAQHFLNNKDSIRLQNTVLKNNDFKLDNTAE
jgi:hypothetical protein